MNAAPTPRKALNRALIVATALEILDSDGLLKLSMRRLATTLDVAPMALYHHVASKADLLDAIATEVLSGIGAKPPAADPIEALRDEALLIHRITVERPYTVPLLVTAAPPSAAEAIERVLARIRASGPDRDAAGLSPPEEKAELMVRTLVRYVFGDSLIRPVAIRRDSAKAEVTFRFGLEALLAGFGSEAI